jgi:ligand-binding sensor domain-containing protein
MKTFLLIILTCILSHLFAQVPPKVFHHLSVNDGLSQSSVVSIAQDSMGFIWIATQDGLNRYDGNEFIYFEKYFDDITNAANNRLGKIFIDNKGTLWIIPNTHVPEFYNAYKRSFTQVSDWKNISCMSQDGAGNYWLGTYNGSVLKYDKRKQTKVYKIKHQLQHSNQVYQCFEDSREQLWITSSDGLFFLDKQADTIIPVQIKNNYASVYCITEDANGTLWLGTLGRGIFYKTISNTSFVPFNTDGYKKFTNDNFSELTIETIFCDGNNNVWTGTYGSGIYLINNKEKTISNYTPDKRNTASLNYKDVLCILQDRENIIWIGTDGGGVNIYDRNSGLFKGYSSATVPAEVAVDIIRCIYKDHSGNTWLGTSGKGLTRLMPYKNVAGWKTFVHEPEQKNSIAGNRIMCLAEDKNSNLWVGTQETGITVFNNKTQQFYSLKNKNSKAFFPDKTIWCLYPQPDGSMWAGTESNGLCLINNEGKLLKQVLIKSGEKIIKNIRCMAKGNNGDIWIGTDEDGLYKYNLQKDVYEPICSNNIKLAKIKCLYFQKNKNKLWIGTNGHGLACLDISTNNVNFFSTRHGLPNNVVYGIVSQDEASLWLSTNKGICNFKIPAAPGILPHVVNYTQKDALHNMEYNTGAYYKDDAGNIYFGGIDGYNWFNAAISACPYIIVAVTKNGFNS